MILELLQFGLPRDWILVISIILIMTMQSYRHYSIAFIYDVIIDYSSLSDMIILMLSNRACGCGSQPIYYPGGGSLTRCCCLILIDKMYFSYLLFNTGYTN